MKKLIIPASMPFSASAIANQFALLSQQIRGFADQEERVQIMAAYNGVTSLLKTQVLEYFKKEVVQDIPITTDRVMKKLINSRYKVYTKPPKREGDEVYIERLESLDYEMLGVERLAGACGSVAFVRSYNEQTDKMVGHVATWFIPIFYEGDPDPRGLIYPMSNTSTKREDQRYIVWTDAEHFMLSAKGAILFIPGNEEMVNDYGVVPVLFAHNDPESITGEFLREPADDLVNAQLIYNCRDTMLSNLNFFQSFGQPWMSGGDTGVNEIRLDPASVLALNDKGHFDFASPGANPAALIEAMRFKIETAAQNYDLKIKWGDASGGATSGEHQRILEIELTSALEGDQGYWRKFESDRAAIDSAILESYGKSPVNVDDYSVDFPAAHIGLTWTERKDRYEYLRERNILSDIDIAMKENPDLDEKQAQELIEKNKLLNAPVQAATGLAARLAAPSA